MKKCVLAMMLIVILALLSPCWGQEPQASVNPAAAKQDVNLDSYIQVLRSNLRTEKVAIVTEAMRFSDAESAVFWPIYRTYELELSKLNDQKVALLKDYAQHLDKMPAAKAKELAEKTFALEQQRTDLKRKFFKEFEKVMPANRVAKFFQVDNRLDLLMNVQIASQVPIID
jgi:hypothetical protein